MRFSQIVVGVVVASALCIACYSAAEPPTAPPPTVPAPLSLSIHYLDGLSARSSEKSNDIRFLYNGCHLSLLLTNTTKEEIHLWKPNCPEGDDAIRLEFKLNKDSKEVGTARVSQVYTGGMGVPKTMKLVPGDSLVYRIDFANYWSLPFVLQPGAKRELLVRAVYESTAMNPARERLMPDLAPKSAKVWKGRIETDWEPVHIANHTDADAPRGHQGSNLLE